MGQILIQSTPKGVSNAAIFDPANEPAQGPKQFSALRFVGTPQNGVVGGRFSLPIEFDTRQFASAFVQEGQPVLAMQQEQPVQGTGFVSEGWRPWRYPDKGQLLTDETGQPKYEERDNPNYNEKSNPDVPKRIRVPMFEAHPLAGKTHTVPSMEVNGPTYVLLCRPLIVQEQVNELYGLVSIDHMTAEVYGETIAGSPKNEVDTGMLSEQRLRTIRNMDNDIAVDRAAEENLGRSTVVHTTLPSNIPQKLVKPPQRVSR